MVKQKYLVNIAGCHEGVNLILYLTHDELNILLKLEDITENINQQCSPSLFIYNFSDVVKDIKSTRIDYEEHE